MNYEDEHDNVPGMGDISSEDLSELLEEAVGDGEIEEKSPGYGIALAVLDGGWDGLSPKQRAIFDKHIQPILKRRAEALAVQRIWDRAPD
ncbi:hypothetical protein [Achromobacter denitrificans]|uniref:hypothetical protein n=1 Tax=Achromobacter denitrificans TaxID=32002 RepID=UPI000F662F4C|nr:hypothetical protein [Achromobacter denitrificans]RSE88617.1 hypothetical protein EGU64_05190 [Achromobacter denitrificans]